MNEQEKSSAVWAELSSKDSAVIARLRAVADIGLGYWENRQREPLQPCPLKVAFGRVVLEPKLPSGSVQQSVQQ